MESSRCECIVAAESKPRDGGPVEVSVGGCGSANSLCGKSAHNLGDDCGMSDAVRSRYGAVYLPCSATTLKMNTTERVMTTTGSTFRPGDSSV
jgi:hypothetical protein